MSAICVAKATSTHRYGSDLYCSYLVICMTVDLQDTFHLRAQPKQFHLRSYAKNRFGEFYLRAHNEFFNHFVEQWLINAVGAGIINSYFERRHPNVKKYWAAYKKKQKIATMGTILNLQGKIRKKCCINLTTYQPRPLPQMKLLVYFYLPAHVARKWDDAD